MSVRFSVIIPAFNAAATLARAIDSVRAQSWPAHEIIVVDDGSTDATAEIARQYGEAVRLIQQPNSGRVSGAQCRCGGSNRRLAGVSRCRRLVCARPHQAACRVDRRGSRRLIF